MKVGYFLSTASVAGGANRSILDLIKQLRQIDDSFSCFVVVNAHGTMEDALNEIGVKCYVQAYTTAIKNSKHWKTFGKRAYNIYAKHRLRKVLKQEKPDIIHNNSLPTTIGMELAMKEHIPYICHIRENVWSGLGMQFYAPNAVKKTVNKAACVIAISDFIKASYQGFNQNRNTVVLNDGLVTDDYYLPDRSVLDNETVNILIVGVINPQKGQKDAVMAVESLTRRGYDIRLTILGTRGTWQGSTSYADDLISYVEQHELKNVTFIDPISDIEELKALRSMQDINLVCSAAEGLGRTTIESMLSGALTIAADAGATPEIIADRSTGLLYDSGDVESLARCIEWAVMHKKEAREIAAKGQENALKRFAIEGYSEEIMQIYSDIIENKNLN